MSIDGRLGSLQALERQSFAVDAFVDDLLERCRAAMLNMTGDPDRDVVRLEPHIVEPYHDVLGSAPEGHVRLLLSVKPLSGEAVEVTVVATKGAVEVDAEALGQSVELYGNRVHIARGFDILLETAITHGVTQIVGRPVDDRVRKLYVLMGFVDGEVLDLHYARSLERAVTWIDTQYDECAGRFPSFDRPW